MACRSPKGPSHRARIALVCLCIALASPTLSQTPEDGQGTPIAVAPQIPDAALAQRLRDILSALGEPDVSVAIEAGVVSLSGDVSDAATSTEIADIARRLEGVVAVRNRLAETGRLDETINPAIERFRARISQAIARVPLFLLAAVIFAAVVWIGALLARSPLWDRPAPNRFIAGILRKTVRILFVLGGLVVALDVVGATALLGTILGAAGIVGLAIGFAVRDTVENFVASVMLSLRQPFRPNDLVEIDGDSGRVIRLTSRATILLSLDGNHIRIPNAVVFKSRIVNYTRNAARRFVFDIGIDPEADLEATRRLAEQALAETSFVLATPEPIVWIEAISEAGVVLRVTGWIDQETTGFASARGDAMRLVKEAIEAAGVSIPDTTYRIRFEGTPPSPIPAEPAGAVQPRPTRAPVAERPAERDRSEEKAVVALVAAERHGEDDLLRPDAPQE